MINGEYDILLFAEHGLNPRKLGSGQSWHDRMGLQKAMRSAHSVLGYSTDVDYESWKVQGGTGITVTKDYKVRKVRHGVDPTGLGRWTWMLIKGKGNRK